MRLKQIPSSCFRFCGVWGLIPFAVFTLFSGYMITRSDVSADFSASLPADDPFSKKSHKLNSYFSDKDFIIISIENTGSKDLQSIRAIADISAGLQSIPEVDSVVSLTTVKDMLVTEDEISFVPLYDGTMDDRALSRIKKTVRSDELLRMFLLSKDEKAYSLYVFPKENADNSILVPKIQNILDKCGQHDAHVFGDRVLKYIIKKGTFKDLLLLSLTGMLLVFLSEILISRSLMGGIALLTSTFLSVVWTFGLFPLFNVKFEITTILVPVIIIALSTTYGVHLLRFFRLDESGGIPYALNTASPTIVYAGFTTMVGFSTLLLFRIKILKIVGGFLILGIVFSVLASLFVLPVLLSVIQLGYKSRSFVFRTLHGKKQIIPVYALLLFTLWSAAGILMVGYDYRVRYIFKKKNPVTRTMNYMYTRYGGLEQLEVVVDTGVEYGLVNLDVFQRLKRATEQLRAEKNIGQVVSFIDFVEWVNGKLSGSSHERTPANEEEIGEALELLSSGDIGLGVNAFIDASYTKAKIIIRFGSRDTSTVKAGKLLSTLLGKINSVFSDLPQGVHYNTIGIPIQNRRELFYIVRGQLLGIAFFIPILFLFLIALFRSLKLAALSIIPTVTGVLFYFGFMGWMRFPITRPSGLSIAVVLGVSVDDAIYFVLFFRNNLGKLGRSLAPGVLQTALKNTRHGAGIAIIQTTAIIVVGLSVFQLSSYSVISQSGLLIMLSLIVCTLVTLIELPYFIELFFIDNE